jgi:hypothetical protein
MVGKALEDLRVVPIHTDRFHRFHPSSYNVSLLIRQGPNL